MMRCRMPVTVCVPVAIRIKTDVNGNNIYASKNKPLRIASPVATGSLLSTVEPREQNESRCEEGLSSSISKEEE